MPAVVTLVWRTASRLDLAALLLGSGLSPRLRGDPSRLRQVLFNLIGKALKFTTAGRVDVTLTHRPPPGRWRRSRSSPSRSTSAAWPR